MALPTPPSSKALIKRSTETELMPPPPPLKRLKRPAQVLDEDSYTDALVCSRLALFHPAPSSNNCLV